MLLGVVVVVLGSVVNALRPSANDNRKEVRINLVII